MERLTLFGEPFPADPKQADTGSHGFLCVSKNFAPFCFHSASTGSANANAALEGGA